MQTEVYATEKITEIRTTESFKQLFKLSLNWGFNALLVTATLVAGVWTLLPTAILPWGAHKTNLIGYISHCSFAPVSSIILLGGAAFGIYRAFKKKGRNPVGYIIFPAAIIATLIGIFTMGIDLNLLFVTGLGIGGGVVVVMVVELIKRK